MTILYLSDIRFPLERANGIQTMETCAALAARGHRVHLLVRPDTHVPPRDPLAFYGLSPSPCLRIERARVFGRPAARRAGYLTQAVGQMLARRRWDVVLTRDLGIADVALRFPAWMRPPVVYESHGYAPVFAETRSDLVAGARPASSFKVARLRRRERRVWRAAGGYVATTGVLAAELREQFGARARMITAPNGVRLEPGRAFKPPPTEGTPVAAYAGHFYPWKGAAVLIDALARLPGVRGLFIGGHPAESDGVRLRSRARDLGLTDRVTFTGLVARTALPALLRNAHVLVMPTVATPSARYTCPLKLFEYMSAGRPIVASDLPPLRELVDDGRTALLVAPGDPEALAAGMHAVLADAATAERMARAALEQVADYAWGRRAERLELLFREVLAARASRRGSGAGGARNAHGSGGTGGGPQDRAL